jgi:hypothetical protein
MTPTSALHRSDASGDTKFVFRIPCEKKTIDWLLRVDYGR